jgi:hypothetical protein
MLEHKGWKLMVLRRLYQIVVPLLLYRFELPLSTRQASVDGIDTLVYHALMVRSEHMSVFPLDISMTGAVVTLRRLLHPPPPTSVASQTPTPPVLLSKCVQISLFCEFESFLLDD